MTCKRPGSLAAMPYGQIKTAQDLEAVINKIEEVDPDESDPELTAQRNPERAQHHIERYRSIKRKMSALHAFRLDKRLRALECYAEAAVARAHGQPERAVLLLNEAFEIWSSIGYAWRGVVSSLALYELTKETHFREYASINIQRFSASWITRRFELVFPAQRPWETPLSAAGSPGS